MSADPSAEARSRALKPSDAAARLEAALMTADRATAPAKLLDALELDRPALDASIEELNAAYAATGRTFRIEHVAGGLRVMTLPEHAPTLEALHRTGAGGKLTPSQLETLAVVAYRQPVLRAEVEAIRGVACGETLRGLMEAHLVRIIGRADEVGRPMLYGTTKRFLEVFGLASTRDLPEVEL